MNEKHLGSELADNIEKMSKKRIAKYLAINYRTLMSRLADGKFTASQIAKLKERGYLK